MKQFFVSQQNSKQDDLVCKIMFRFYTGELVKFSLKGYSPEQCHLVSVKNTLDFFNDDLQKSHPTFRNQKEAFQDLLEAFHIGNYFYEVNNPITKCVIIWHTSEKYPSVC